MGTLRKIVAATLSIFLVMLFMGSTCDKSTNSKDEENPQNQLIGTWVLTTMSVNGVMLPIEMVGWSMTITFKADNTYTKTMDVGEGEETETGTWSATTTELTTTSNGVSETFPYSISGDKLSITLTIDIDEDGTDDTVVLTFTKQ